MSVPMSAECCKICAAGEVALVNAFTQAGLGDRTIGLWDSVHQMLDRPEDMQTLTALCERLKNLSLNPTFRTIQVEHLTELGLDHLLNKLGLNESQIHAVLNCLATVPVHA